MLDFLKDLFLPFTNTKAIVFIVIIGFIVYFNALFNSFVWDDVSIFQNPELLKGFNLIEMFGNNRFNVLYYRPLSAAYFTLMFQTFESNYFIYHLFQIVLHLVNSVLVYLLLKKFFKNPIAFFSSLIFLVHPVNVESVAYISSTNAILSAFFGLFALLLVAEKSISNKKYIVIAFLIFCSLFSKETGFIFIALIFSYVILFERRNITYLTLATVIPAGMYIFLNSMREPIRYSTTFFIPIQNLSLPDRLINLPAIIMYYIKIFVFPLNMSINQLWVVNNISFNNFFLYIFAILIIGGFLIWQFLLIRKHDKLYSKIFIFFIAWIIISMIPYLQIIPLQNTVADRWLYLPVVGFIGVISVIIQNIKVRNKNLIYIGIFISFLILFLFSVRTVFRNADWENKLTLYSHDIQHEDNYHIEDMLGLALYEEKDYEQAIYHIKRSTQMDPRPALSYYQLGLIYGQMQDLKTAEMYLQKSISQDPNFDLPYFALAELTYKYKGPKEALPIINYLVKKFPDNETYLRFQLLLEQEIEK